MQNFFGIKLDTESMSTEELQKIRQEIRNMLFNVEHQLLLRKMAERKYSSCQSPHTEI